MTRNLSFDFGGRLGIPVGPPVVVSYGMGWDSTGLLGLLHKRGIRPEMILFANTGAEKDATYAYLPIINAWCRKVGFPEVTVTMNKTLASTPYNDIEGNYFHTESMPGPAFGFTTHECSVKWKRGPIDKFIEGANGAANKYGDDGTRTRTVVPGKKIRAWAWTPAAEAWERGEKVTKLIGFDASPADLKRRDKDDKEIEDSLRLVAHPEDLEKIADPKKRKSAWERAKAKVNEFNRYHTVYPLIEAGLTRPELVTMITDYMGLPLPVKSACYFCPASKKWEIWWLAANEPHNLEKALAVEYNAMVGKNSRWGRRSKDKPKAGTDPETYDKEWLEFIIDTGKKWPSTKTTVGLGCSFAWGRYCRENKIVNRALKVVIAPAVAMAEVERLRGGNAIDSRFKGIPLEIAA